MLHPTGGIIPEEHLARLTELFTRIEGSSKPLSRVCQEAEFEFNSLVEKIHTEKVQPEFKSVTFTAFLSYVRNYCRTRAYKEGRPFPCV